MSPSAPAPISKRYIPYISRPGRRLFSIGMELEDRVGVLAEVSSALSRAGLNLLASSGAAVHGDGTHATLSFIGEAQPDGVSVAELKRSLEAIPSVRRVEVQADRDGVVIDDLFPLYSGTGRRMILMSLDPLRDMLRHMSEVLGSGGSVLVFAEGQAFGDAAWKKVIEYIGPDWAPDHLDYLAKVLTALGYGEVEVTEMDPKRWTATVRIESCMECLQRESPTIACHFMRGVVESLFAAVWKRPLTSTETTCEAHGEAACEFRISPAEPPGTAESPL